MHFSDEFCCRARKQKKIPRKVANKLAMTSPLAQQLLLLLGAIRQRHWEETKLADLLLKFTAMELSQAGTTEINNRTCRATLLIHLLLGIPPQT